MNAIWIALLGVFAALIPVFILAANKSQTAKQAANSGTDDGSTAVLVSTTPHGAGSHGAGAHHHLTHHADHGGSSDGGGAD